MAARKKKHVPQVGDVFGVPLQDGTLGMTIFVRAGASGPTCVLFANRVDTVDELSGVSEGLPVAALNLTEDMMENGTWRFVENRPINERIAALPLPPESGSSSATYAHILLNYYHRIDDDAAAVVVQEWQQDVFPWIQLRPGKLTDVAAPSKARMSAPLDEVTEGPARVHIRILYDGDGLPSVEDVRRRNRIQERIDRLGIGEVTDAGGGEGIMEIHFETEDVRRARDAVRFVLHAEGALDVSEVIATSRSSS